MSENGQQQDLVNRATEAMRLAQDDARKLARETGTDFVAEEENQTAVYPATEKRIAHVGRDRAEDSG